MPKPVHQVVVDDKFSVSENMVRVILKGDAVSRFPADSEGGYIKLLFPREEHKPYARSFTVRDLNVAHGQLAIDMVAHNEANHSDSHLSKGPAARWASEANIGTTIDIQGPGACKRVNLDADWFLLAGDMSALPAIAVNLATLPDDAKGYVLIEIIDEKDKVSLNVPKGIELHWMLNPSPQSANSVLEDTVMALPWLEGQVSVWVSGEFSASRALRQYFRHDRQVQKDNTYVSCYWKIGDTDEGMKAAKKSDSEAW